MRSARRFNRRAESSPPPFGVSPWTYDGSRRTRVKHEDTLRWCLLKGSHRMRSLAYGVNSAVRAERRLGQELAKVELNKGRPEKMSHDATFSALPKSSSAPSGGWARSWRRWSCAPELAASSLAVASCDRQTMRRASTSSASRNRNPPAGRPSRGCPPPILPLAARWRAFLCPALHQRSSPQTRHSIAGGQNSAISAATAPARRARRVSPAPPGAALRSGTRPHRRAPAKPPAPHLGAPRVAAAGDRRPHSRRGR